MAMNGVTINRQYNSYVRGMIAARHELLAGKRGAARKEFFDRWAEKGHIQELRRILRDVGNQPRDTIIYDDDGEGYTVIYREPFEFEGTKQEVLDELYEHYATRICSPYDCTGQRFTRWYKVGYLGNNLWRVAEAFGLDV